MKISKKDLEMADDVYGAMLAQTPQVHRLTIWALAAFVLSFIIWAYFAKLDRVATGMGKVVPSSQIQIIQSLDGGILQQLYVTEGMVVRKDQPLARIDDTRFRADLAEQRQEVDSLRADIIRLRSELASILVADVPDWKLQIKIAKKTLIFPDDLNQNLPHLVERQQDEYQTGLDSLSNQVAIQGQQIQQRHEESRELKSKIKTLEISYKLALREIELTRPLAEKNIVPEVELLKLERSVNSIKGELNSIRLLVPKLKAAMAEAVLKRREAVLNYRADAREQLNELQDQFSRITEAQVGVKDKVEKALIISPVVGTIKTLHITTMGGVVQPGQVLLEIVPTEDKLLIEAKIKPKDIAFIHLGLPAVVKITAYDFTRYGGLKGVVEHISADTTQDEDGNSFYIIRVRTKISDIQGNHDMPIIPGMMTSVDVMIGKRTVLEYILNPVLRAKAMALREL
ncbi:HlyD family type I secretion periplasmic adaptor subunit [Moritella viscosa]|uniref:Membrane fusion protein (MFP) family protein n=1 Tax=Moritella viscosa TaxID=80854 RepID=A0A090IIU5_9GAMM|nr:HlyD family type I secretion periplasmic adaptor subunit [Moritella viscosa]CED61077.1 secretion protein, HlyD family [Moritella viscosa]SGY95029.1 HlyD family secretion protein [Moritella viscosa]SGZ00260.1 HlyD family secretion protein [Moritella viscosa]SGZ00677.1 HlyD family secretion protein [Moritella viscosa]SGZ06682.1 HlyD family secretion protein [Moritella viscosa]